MQAHAADAASLMRAFGNESRLMILCTLAEGERSVGELNQVIPLSRASAAVGAQGLMVEVHHEPDAAMSDGAQSLYPEQFDQLCQQVLSISRIFDD